MKTVGETVHLVRLRHGSRGHPHQGDGEWAEREGVPVRLWERTGHALDVYDAAGRAGGLPGVRHVHRPRVFVLVSLALQALRSASGPIEQ